MPDARPSAEKLTKKRAWDRSLVYQLLRDRADYYGGLVDRLMADEARLIALRGENPRPSIKALSDNIAIIERLGGNASALIQQRDELEQRHAEHQPELSEIQKQLVIAREGLKWSEMAYSGIHWLCLTESSAEPVLAALAAGPVPAAPISKGNRDE